MADAVREIREFFIGGEWVPAHGQTLGDVVNPATEQTIARVALGDEHDVDRAVAAAEAAIGFGATSREERLALLRRILAEYQRRYEEFVAILPVEMGAPVTLARNAQVYMGVAHLTETINGLERLVFEERRGTTRIAKVPAGVAALITPWNWPLNQIVTKVAGALAAGCPMVLKPSELAPLDAFLFAEVLADAGVPPGVFNLVNGLGPVVGRAMCEHPSVAVVSFTGSTRAGIEIARAAAGTVKRVHQELGGKSPNIILDDADLETAVTTGVNVCYANAGQSCSVATRMLVPAHLMDEVSAIARRAAEAHVVGDPLDPATTMGPLANAAQFAKVQALIAAGIAEGAELVTGGTGRPEGFDRGYFTQPTVFANVRPDMTIAQEEIFGPVLSIIPYRDEDEAVAIANGTVYGLAGVVQSRDLDRARRIADRIHSGHVYINHNAGAYAAVPFGGLKQSGNGIEHAEWGIEAFLDTKALLGWYPEA